MNPIEKFQNGLAKARNTWEKSVKTNGNWLLFFHTKMVLRDKLDERLPQSKEISDFWQVVNNVPTSRVGQFIAQSIKRIEQSNMCRECHKSLEWPAKICPICKEDRLQLAKVRREAFRKGPKKPGNGPRKRLGP